MKHTGTTVNNSVALLPNRMLQIGRAIMKKDRETKKEITKERKNEWMNEWKNERKPQNGTWERKTEAPIIFLHWRHHIHAVDIHVMQ